MPLNDDFAVPFKSTLYNPDSLLSFVFISKSSIENLRGPVCVAGPFFITLHFKSGAFTQALVTKKLSVANVKRFIFVDKLNFDYGHYKFGF